MNRIQYACFALIASAFVLAGLLLVQLNGRMIQSAHAGTAILRDNLTVVTAQSRDGEDALFVLDSISERLMIYRLEAGRKRLELVGAANLADVFAQVPTAGGAGAGDRRGR
jgi:hypothetical protein